TILELAGLTEPTHVDGIAQQPMHGTSFLHTFAGPGGEERHTQQYFKIYGYRAMYKDGWWLAQSIPWKNCGSGVLSIFHKLKAMLRVVSG
ncbi:MAG: hypothetical protein ACLPX8_06575, partial [Bryobacteraceae bacterium]